MKRFFIIISIFVLLFTIGCGKKNVSSKSEIPKSITKKTINMEKSMEDRQTVVLDTNMGEITLEVYPQVAPKTVENFVTHVKNGYYNGVIFHRVIEDFMIQGGDPTGTGAGGESIWGEPFEDEISAVALGLDENKVPNSDMTIEKYNEMHGYTYDNSLPSMQCVYGTICMANAGPNTNGSQFFIVTKDACEWLDGRHTVFGKVVKGMEVVDNIEKVKTAYGDRPVEDVVINKAFVK